MGWRGVKPVVLVLLFVNGSILNQVFVLPRFKQATNQPRHVGTQQRLLI